jgi:hypothetical protein
MASKDDRWNKESAAFDNFLDSQLADLKCFLNVINLQVRAPAWVLIQTFRAKHPIPNAPIANFRAAPTYLNLGFF